MLYNCQKIGIKDKFFYDSIIQKLDENLNYITKSGDLLILGVALAGNPDFIRDNLSFALKFYEYTYKNRFLLK